MGAKRWTTGRRTTGLQVSSPGGLGGKKAVNPSGDRGIKYLLREKPSEMPSAGVSLGVRAEGGTSRARGDRRRRSQKDGDKRDLSGKLAD